MLPLGTERGLAFEMDPLTSPFIQSSQIIALQTHNYPLFRLLRPVVTGYLFFSVSSPKRRIYVLYQQAIIWILPVFSTIEKKVEKKVSPPISPFLEHKKWKLFSHLFWFPDLFMNSCSMQYYHCLSSSLDAIVSIRWTFPLSMMSRLPPSYPRVIRHFPHHNCHQHHVYHLMVPLMWINIGATPPLAQQKCVVNQKPF